MSNGALNLAQVLVDEHYALLGRPLPSETTPPPVIVLDGAAIPFANLGEPNLAQIHQLLLGERRSALCLSGGGIRSAAFALGVVECLAGYRAQPPDKQHGNYPTALPNAPKQPLLQQFDYLSSVSGGGYLASWLSTWLNLNAGHAQTVLKLLKQTVRDRPEAEPIANLRRNTDYLAPRLSALSPDVWSGVAGIIRNILLNWLVLLPPFLGLVIATKLLAWGLGSAMVWGASIGDVAANMLLVLAGLFWLCALSFVAGNRPTRHLVDFSQFYFFWLDLVPFLAGSACLVLALATDPGRAWADSSLRHVPIPESVRVWLGFLPLPEPIRTWLGDRSITEPYRTWLAGVLAGAALYTIAWFAAWFWRLVNRPRNKDQGQNSSLADLCSWVIAGTIFGAIVGIGVQLWTGVIAPQHPTRWALWLATLSLPWLLFARMVADAAFLGLLGRVAASDSDQEWSARAGGVYGVVAVCILLWFGLVLIAPSFVGRHWHAWTKALFVAGAAGGGGAAWLSKSRWTSAVADINETKSYIGWNGLAMLGAAAFGVALTIGAGTLAELLLFRNVFTPDVGMGSSLKPWAVAWYHPYGALVILAILGAGASWFININLFSLHGIYRNRLVRAFLGASRPQRIRKKFANRFTDFASDDSLPIADLWPRDPPKAPIGDDWRPLHIVNATLNLVSSRNLAWQERKAAPFTFSALHAGSGSTALRRTGAYRNSGSVNGREPYGTPEGVRLGTAMAISGAAASPDMGYFSSAGLSVLMTFFNVRLGWWMPNPLHEKHSRRGPGWALWPLIIEMFGLTTERRRWLYLSDGGHFENLGLYEMVQRRCAVIVVVDATADPNYGFADLGNALRKIWIDLGIRIDMIGLDRLKQRFQVRPTPATDAPYWAIGHIRYPEAQDDAKQYGRLLYLKTGLHGTEAMDVMSYALAHDDFPQEKTENQFFTESQFESYRALGYAEMYKALAYAARHAKQAPEAEAPAPPPHATHARTTEQTTVITRGTAVITDRETIVDDVDGTPGDTAAGGSPAAPASSSPGPYLEELKYQLPWTLPETIDYLKQALGGPPAPAS